MQNVHLKTSREQCGLLAEVTASGTQGFPSPTPACELRVLAAWRPPGSAVRPRSLTSQAGEALLGTRCRVHPRPGQTAETHASARVSTPQAPGPLQTLCFH